MEEEQQPVETLEGMQALLQTAYFDAGALQAVSLILSLFLSLSLFLCLSICSCGVCLSLS